MPTSDASTSTMNWWPGLGKMSTGAEVKRDFCDEKAASASGDQEKGWRVEVSAESGAASRLNPWMKRR